MPSRSMIGRCSYCINSRSGKLVSTTSGAFAFDAEEILAFHRSLPGYRPTPVHSFDLSLARFGRIRATVKDESQRMGLKAFKVLGASYAMKKLLEESPEIETFVTATDGNHGRAVAWAARYFGKKAVVFMPSGSAPARVEAISEEGAHVELVDGDYDEALLRAREAASSRGWQLLQDTSWEGYTRIPAVVTAGYTTMLLEMIEQPFPAGRPEVDVVFVQGGVGSFAAAVCNFLNARYGESRPVIVAVEPVGAACLLESAQKGGAVTTRKRSPTIMAGLDCPTASLAAWPMLEAWVDLFVAITDEYSLEAMRLFYRGVPGQRIVSGESGAAGLAGLLALDRDPDMEEAAGAVGLGPGARVLIFNTEGDTDPVHYREVVGSISQSG